MFSGSLCCLGRPEEEVLSLPLHTRHQSPVPVFRVGFYLVVGDAKPKGVDSPGETGALTCVGQCKLVLHSGFQATCGVSMLEATDPGDQN